MPVDGEAKPDPKAGSNILVVIEHYIMIHYDLLKGPYWIMATNDR